MLAFGVVVAVVVVAAALSPRWAVFFTIFTCFLYFVCFLCELFENFTRLFAGLSNIFEHAYTHAHTNTIPHTNTHTHIRTGKQHSSTCFCCCCCLLLVLLLLTLLFLFLCFGTNSFIHFHYTRPHGGTINAVSSFRALLSLNACAAANCNAKDYLLFLF